MADWRDSHACGTAVLRVQAISLNDCDVYSYNSDLESDPFGKPGHGFEYGVPKRLLVLTLVLYPHLLSACRRDCKRLGLWLLFLQQGVRGCRLICMALETVSGVLHHCCIRHLVAAAQKMKRILYLSCRAKSKASADDGEVCL